MKRLTILFAAVLALFAPPLAAQEFPPLTGRVVDSANIIPADIEAELTAKLEALEAQTQRQLVVATVPDLDGYDIADFGYRLGREWGLGDAERNDGALLLVAPTERKVRIEVGYGLEGSLTDALSSIIIQNSIIPRFRDDDYPGGIVAGTDAIIAQLQLPPEEAARIAAEATEARNSDGGFPVGTLIWLGFMFFFFVLPIIRSAGRRRRYRSKGSGPWGERGGQTAGDVASNIILWEIGSAIARGAMSGGGGGGSFGGGGGLTMPYLNEKQHKIVSDAVGEAELQTSGEILTVLADRSDGYSDVVMLWAAALSFTAMSAFAAFPEPFLNLWDSLVGGWSHEWTTGEIASMTIGLGLLTFAVAWGLQQWDPLRFALIPAPVKTARVHDQAVKHFKVGAEARTHGRTGVLIYLSMSEHRAEIVADRPIAEKVDAEVWGEAMGDMLVEIKQGRIAEGMAAGVRDVGFVLGQHFERDADDENELPDRLIEV